MTLKRDMYIASRAGSEAKKRKGKEKKSQPASDTKGSRVGIQDRSASENGASAPSAEVPAQTTKAGVVNPGHDRSPLPASDVNTSAQTPPQPIKQSSQDEQSIRRGPAVPVSGQQPVRSARSTAPPAPEEENWQEVRSSRHRPAARPAPLRAGACTAGKRSESPLDWAAAA